MDPDNADTYVPELAVFFGHLSSLKAGPLVERLRTGDQDFIIQAMASEIIALAPDVVVKHRWVNRAFILTGLTLGFFLCTGISTSSGSTSPPRPSEASSTDEQSGYALLR